MSFLPLYFYFIVASFVASLFAYSSNRNTYLKFFPPFLLLTIGIEYTGHYLRSVGQNNISLYNFFTVFEFVFYMILISIILRNIKAKKVIRISAFAYAAISISNILFFQGMKTFHTITYSLGCLLIVAVCIYYFLELFRSPRSVSLMSDPAFWICSGLLFFYCCGFPLYAFINFWAKVKWMAINFQKIVGILNIFLYSLFTIAFLCSKIRRSTSSLS